MPCEGRIVRNVESKCLRFPTDTLVCENRSKNNQASIQTVSESKVRFRSERSRHFSALNKDFRAIP